MLLTRRQGHYSYIPYIRYVKVTYKLQLQKMATAKIHKILKNILISLI